VAGALDIISSLEHNLSTKPVSIIDFAESPKFCGRTLYPRQRLLLKLMFLEDLTDEENRILDYWISGGYENDEIEISPDIRERSQWLRDNGYQHFREVVFVGGRRCSKGFITGLAMAKKVFDTVQLQDPGKYYGIDEDKEIVFSCIAASQEQAKGMQYADFSAMVNSCAALGRHIHKVQELEFSLMTETDIRRTAEWKRQGRRVQRDISKVRGKAHSANSRTIRGSATMAIVFDEFAHFQQGESDQADSEIYAAAVPALAQFGRDAMIFCNPPEAPVWMEDLSFKPIGDIKTGDKVVGWNNRLEASPTSHKERVLQGSTVTNVSRRQSPIVKVTMESGRTFRCTPDHKWLTTLSSGGSSAAAALGEWYAEPKVGRQLAHVIDPTPPLDKALERDAAWLGGIFDGEGYAARGKALTICQSKGANPKICNKIEEVLTNMGFDWAYHQSTSKLGIGGAYHIKTYTDERANKQAATDFANWTRPVQIHKLQSKLFTSKWRNKDTILSIEPDGYGEVVALTTSTANYVCNGYASKNCNSSPYSKVGKFYERFEESMAMDNGTAVAPSSLGIRLPSWSLFEGWWEDPTYVGPKKCVTVSPDWEWDKKDDDGNLFFTDDDRQAIIIAQQEEKGDPIKYKVERRARFSEVINAYLDPLQVDRMMAGRPEDTNEQDPDNEGKNLIRYHPFKTNWENSSYQYSYHAHIDPSSTTAGFGFALGHIELFQINEKPEAHAVFDIVKRWVPAEFSDNVIDWEPILEELLDYCNLFRPETLTFDQHQSQWPMQWLRKELRKRNIGEVRIFEKTANIQTNWNRAEVFRTALYQGLIHCPNDTADAHRAGLELKYLQEIKNGRIPRVEKQDEGPIQTKDMADCMMEVVESLIGSGLGNDRGYLADAGLTFGARGGYAIGKMSPKAEEMSALYSRNKGEQSFRGSRGGPVDNPARRAFGGRPVPRHLPNRRLPGS